MNVTTQSLAELPLNPGLQITNMGSPLLPPSTSPIQTRFIVRFEKELVDMLPIMFIQDAKVDS